MSTFAPAGKTLQTLLFALTISILNNFYQAYSSFNTITAAESFQQFLNISYEQNGRELSENELVWIWSLNLNALIVGNILGTFFTPWCCERLGRKMTLLMTNCGIFWAVALCSSAIWLLMPGLFLLSRIIGAVLSNLNFGALALFITEFPSTKLRGLTIFVCGISYNLVGNLGMLMGMDIFLGRNLEALIGFGLLPALMAILSSIPLKETPKYLLLKREDKERAMESLRFYQGHSIDHNVAFAEILKERQQNDQRPLSVLVREVFAQRHLRLALLLGCCSLQLTVGTWPITTTLFADHFPLNEAQLYSSICTGLGLAFNIPGTILSTKVSRRKLLLYAGVVNSACIVMYALFDRLTTIHSAYRYGCLVSNLVYFGSFGISVGTIPFYISGELFPQNFRSVGQSLVFFFSLCIGFIFNICTLPAYSSIGVFAFFLLFTVPQIFCLILLWIYLPETKEREVHEIVEELKAQKRTTKVRDCDQTAAAAEGGTEK